MNIAFEENAPDRIASDDAGGTFYFGNDGSVLYIGPEKREPWYVNASLDKFQHSVKAYENYVTEVKQKETELEQLKVVDGFREAIAAIENYGQINRSYWACIVQQAEEGQL